MANKEIRVLHIDTEKSWRGGQQQAYYLHKGLIEKNLFSLLVCNPNSKIHFKCEENMLPLKLVKMGAEINLFTALKISRICKKENINILLAHSAHALSIGLIAKFFNGKFKLLGVRRVDFHIRKNFLSKFKYNSKLVDKIICVSNAIKSVLVQDGVEEQKLFTIHDGIDIYKFNSIQRSSKLKESLKLVQNDFIVGTVAAFVGHKDYPNLINAAKIVVDRLKYVKFLALGDGPQRSEMKLLVKKLNLDQNFIFTGFQNNVGEYLKIFDIFVLSSKLEGLGTSILDAQSIGLPVIATSAGGIPEVIENDVNGILVEPQNHNHLANAIIDLIEDPGKRKKTGSEAQKTVNKFSVENNVYNNINLYMELLNN